MNLKTIRNSQTSRSFNWLFNDKQSPKQIKSWLFEISQPFVSDKKTIFFLTTAVALVWYKNWLSGLGLGSLATIGAGLSLIMSLWFCDKKQLKLSRPVWYLIILNIILFVSAFFASQNQLSAELLFSGIFLYMQLGIAHIIGSTIKNKQNIINSIIGFSLPIVVVGLYQGLFGPSTSRLWISGAENLINRRAFALFGSPNVLGGVLVIVSLLLLTSLIKYRHRSFVKWVLIIYHIVVLVVLVLTYSRSAWLGLVVGYLVIIFLMFRTWLKYAPIMFIFLLIPRIQQRLLTAISFEYSVDSSLDGRIWALNTAVEVFKQSPILGSGPGSYGGQTAIYHNSPVYLRGLQNGYTSLFYTDNQWVQILVQTGLLGGLALFGFFISIVVYNLKSYFKNKNIYSLMALSVLAALLVIGSFANVLEFGAIALPAGVSLGIGENND